MLLAFGAIRAGRVFTWFAVLVTEELPGKTGRNTSAGSAEGDAPRASANTLRHCHPRSAASEAPNAASKKKEASRKKTPSAVSVGSMPRLRREVKAKTAAACFLPGFGPLFGGGKSVSSRSTFFR